MLKEPNFRSPKLLALAKEAPCCMSCGAFNVGDVVAAHSNAMKHGKGKGIKAHDVTAWVCFHCHNLIDGREGGLSRETRHLMWLEAVVDTVIYQFRTGIVGVLK